LENLFHSLPYIFNRDAYFFILFVMLLVSDLFGLVFVCKYFWPFYLDFVIKWINMKMYL